MALKDWKGKYPIWSLKTPKGVSGEPLILEIWRIGDYYVVNLEVGWGSYYNEPAYWLTLEAFENKKDAIKYAREFMRNNDYNSTRKLMLK